MPDKKYLIEIPDMPDSSGVWDADKWERNKDKFMQKYPTANVFELGQYDENDTDENDQFMLTFDNDADSSGVWDAAKWERNKEAFVAKYPEAHVDRVRYVDYWGNKAQNDKARMEELQQPDEARNAKLAELGYYDDITGEQMSFDLNAPGTIGLKPLSSAIKQNSVSGETTYLDPKVEEFFANDTAHTERQMEMNRLREEYDRNPRVIEQREYEAQMARYAADLEKQIKADMESEVDMVKAARGASAKHQFGADMTSDQMGYLLDRIAGDKAGSGAEENEKLERYNSALKLLQQAKDAREVAGKGLGGGIADTAKDWVRNAATQSDIEMYNEIGNILTSLENKVGNLNEVSAEDIENNLSNDEKALIRAFFEYNAAMADAGQNMSTWYKGGKIFAESIPFMLEFLATGGLATGAGRAATSWMGKGFAKWIANSAKGTLARTVKKGVAKSVSGVAKTMVAAGARTLVAPSTYNNIAEQSVRISEDGHLDRGGNMVKAAVDSYIEQLSEMSGAAFGEVLGGIGRLALGKTAFDKIGAWFGNNVTMQALSRLGFHGLPEEVGEEIFGNALRTITGVDKEALSRMFEKDEFASMIIGFAPMTLIGAGTSAAQMGAVSIGAANAGRRMRQDLSRSYTEEQIDQVVMSLDAAKDANQITEAIKPIITGMAAAGAPMHEIQSVWDYAIAVAKKKAMISAQSVQEMQLTEAKIGEVRDQMGERFWIENEDGTRDVKQVTLNNGNTAYVVSKPDEDGRVAIINADTGQKGTALPEDIKEESWNGTLNAFGAGLVMADRTLREQQRMQEERKAQISEVQNRLSIDPRINVGTEGSPIYLVAQSFNDAGVRYVAQDGSVGNLSWEQVADSIGMPIVVKTDAQIAQEEADALVAAAAERRAKRAKKDAVGTTERDNAVVDAENAVAGANETARHIPMNEDGTVNEAAFWEQSPEEYVKWNDEQNQDGGQDSLQQVAIAKQELMGLLQEANAAQNTSNPTTRKAAKKEVERLADRIARLDAIEQSYMQSLEEEKAAVQQTAATPTATMSEEDLESMDAQYQGILGKTRVQGERVRVMQEYLDKLAEGSVPVVLLTRQNYEEKMKADGLHNAIIRRVKAQVDAGRSVAGFMANGKVYLMDEGLNSIDAARITYIHERQHTFNRTNNSMLAEVANLLESKEKAIEILKTFVGEKGIDVYESLTIEGLADEIVAYSMEKAYTTEDFSVDLQSRGIPSEVISIITEIDNEQRKDQSLSQARRRRGVHSHAAVSGAGSMREDGRNLEQVSGGVLEQQAARPSGSSGRGAQIGEGAEVISDDEGPSFRITKPEDPNGVTPEQIDEINRSVGGELEIGDEDAPVRFSVTAIGEGAGLTILKDDGEGNVAFVLPDGRRFNANNLLKPEDIKSLPNTVLGYMMKDAKSLGNVDSRKEWMLWNKYTLMLNAILLKGSAENGGFDTLSSQWQWIGDTIYKTVAINSDSQYSFSLDITRVCKKNEAVINAIAEMQARLGYGITPGQIMDIYLTTSEEGYQVPCPVCYVFSRYIRNGKYATIMINGQRKYGSELVDPRGLTPEQRKKRIKFWQDELKRIKAENKAHSKEIAKANSDITTLLDEIDKIAKELTNPENNFSEEEKAQMMGKIYELDARYKAALNVVSQASLDSWITQFAIHKVKVDGKEQWVLYEDSYMGFPEEMALDLRQTSTVMRKYPAIQRFRNSRGAAAGKEITFVANNDLGDVPLALGSSAATKDLAKPREMSDEEWNELQEKEYAELKLGVKNLYQRAVEETDPKKKKKLLESAKKRFTAASIYAKQQSLRGGQRMWSWSDNIERLAPDVFVNLLQLEMLGGALQSYSKQLEGIKLVASMNGYVNGSLMGKGNGYREVTAEQTEEVDGQLYLKDGDFMVAEPGKKPFILKTPVYQHTDGKLYVLEFDDVVGIDPFGKEVDGKHMKGLFELNAEYDRAGNIIVGMNDLHIRMCMADDRIFFIIPWHSSGANSHILAQMYEYLGVEYDVKLSQDYTDVQSEKRYKAPTEAEEESDSEAEEEVAEEGEEKKTESNKISQFLVDFWNDHYENAREYAGYGAVAGKDFACGIEGGVEPSDGNGNLSASQIHYRELRDAIFVGVKVPNGVDKNGKAKTKTLSVEEYSEEWFNEIMNDAFLSQVYTKVRALMGDKGMTSADTKAIYPYEYWDESSTYDTADINGARYLEYCRRLGYKPKFCGKLDGKPESDHGNFTDDKGYWKVLIDRRMYAISGRFQDLTPVTADNFTPDLVDPEVTKEEFIVTRVADEAGTQTIVDKAIAREESRPGGIAKVNYDMTLNDALEVYNNGDVRMRVSSPSGVIDLVEEAKKAQAKHDAKDSDVRFRVRTEEEREKLFADAKEKYGVTDNFNAAGYMLPDGSLLDFSEANDGGDPNSRSLDHRDIEGVIMDNGVEYDSRWMYIADFMNEGAIRLLPESAGINMIQAPTEEQRKKIFDFIYKYNGEVILEINDERLNSIVYMEYDRRTSPSRIFRDIDGYFNDGIIPQQDIRFRMSNDNQAIFVSNAAKAVEGIKQEKATPEQWLKMIEKAGGLKAGEDKWMGLSDFLKSSDKKTLTKQEVLDFINENMIVIEEQHYEEDAPDEEALWYKYEESEEGVDEINYQMQLDAENHAELALAGRDLTDEEWEEEYDRLVSDYIEDDLFGSARSAAKDAVRERWMEEEAPKIMKGRPREINITRLDYTTAGLANLHEIALTVPTIESWNESDDIHFGDAGEGRAVAWIRFGETWEQRPSPQISRKVLVIDEIQSKRHQEGREKGYQKGPKMSLAEYRQKIQDFEQEMIDKYHPKDLGLVPFASAMRGIWSEEESNTYSELTTALGSAAIKNSGIPDAPFDKNWHELAMKRMLRYAAENGYDIIAWTKGEQQAERYNIGNVVRNITADGDWYDTNSTNSADGKRARNLYIRLQNRGVLTYAVNEDGIIINGDYTGTPLANVVGKEMAVKLINAEPYEEFDAEDMHIGGEGMKGFYDKMLPAFMNKYGKKWGVKVEDINLPNLENGLTMHSVPVTEEMKASVMEGQVMFRMRGENESAMEFYESGLADYRRKYNELQQVEIFPANEETAKRFGLTLDELKKTGGMYVEDEGLIAIFAQDEADDALVVENAIFHEQIHHLAHFYPYMDKLGEWLWNNTDKIRGFAQFKSFIEDNYDELMNQEMLCYVTSFAMTIGAVSDLEAMVPAEYRNTIRNIENEIGYDRRSEESSRQAERSLQQSAGAETHGEHEGSQNGEEPAGAGETRFRTTGITPEVQEEMDAIHASAILMGNFMKAPNGKDTNLTEEQWLMVRTKNFRDWFGDWLNDPENASKVVDENGEPRVVYHGTAGNIDRFENQQRAPGFWFVDREDVANGYAESASVEFGEDKNVIPVFLNIRNPRTEDAYGEFPAEFALKSYVENDNGVYQEFDTYEEAEAYRKENVPDGWVGASKVGDQHDLVERAVELGHDGVIMKNMHDQAAYAETRVQGTQTNYVVLSPSQIKSATDNTGEYSEGEGDIRFSIRTKPAPKKTGKGYKVFYLKDGKLYPPMVANLGGVDTPVGVWLDAEEGTRAGVSKTGRPQVKQGGKGTQGGSGTLAYRPGWHLGEIPYAIQFNRKDENGDRTLFPADFVWAEVEYANDVDYQEEAMSYGMNANGKFQHSLAGLPKLPTDGSYRYRTNPNPETDPWIITGAMKVNRLLTPSEVDQIVVDAGREPQKRQEGAVTDAQIEALNKELGLEETVSFRFSSSTADEIDIKAMRGISTLRAFNVSFSEMRKIFYDVAEETEKAIMQLRAKQNRTAYDNEKLAREEKELRVIHRRIDWWESVNSQLVSTDTEPTALKDGDFDLEPRTPAEFISKFLTMSMTRVNKQFVDKEGKAGIKKVNKRAGVMLTQDTLRRELGWNEKDWSGFRYILSESEGKSLDEIAEMISEDSDAQSMFVGMDVMDIKNEIIDFLQSVRSYADIRDYIKNERTREAKEERDYLDGLVAATIEQIESSTGMTIDEYNDRIITEELKDIERILRDIETSEIYGKFEDLTDQENEAYQRSLLEGAEGGIQEGDQAVPDLGDGAMDSAAAENSEPQGDSRGADTGDVGDRADESGGSRIPPIGNKRKGLVQEPMELSSESASVDEVVNKGRQKAINENVQANDIFSEKVQRLNNSLAKLRSALAAQREYDVNTVKIITALANELLQIGRLTDMSRSEIKRLLSVIKDATGKEDLSIAVERLMDIMIANQLRSGKSKISELTKIKASKVNASGVEVRGSLDVAGQQMLQTFKDSIAPTMTDETLAENIAIEESNLDSDSDVIRKNAENRLAGYYLAQQYRENILASEAEEKSIREEIKRAKEQHDAGLMDKDAYKEFVKSCYDAIRENRMERVTAYEKLANQLAAKLAGSILNAKLLKDAEKARIEQIHHFANSDMQGMPSVQQGEVKKGIWNNTILRFLFKPLATFDQMLRSFAPKSRNGEGYLWNHFMGGWLRSSENEFKGIQAAHEQLDAKVRSMFAGVKRWSDLFSIEKKLPTMEVKFWDGEKMADFTLTQGNLLYIYMVNKMTDGKMKLRKMGITEEDVNNIARELDPRFIELADWIQDTFLPGLREKYNTLHEKMFGAPMAAIDNYFPIRVLANARTREVDLAVEESSAKPSTITGSIIKRTKNSLALDILGSDAFDVVLEHIEQMEHWVAFAEFNRDLNTLLSYRKFRNRVQNMRGIYGAGTTVWNNFRSVAEIAAGVYKPAVKGDSLDKLITNIAKGVTGAKISFRVYTALKQFLSAPAFVSDASAAALIKSLANPYKAWTWAMKELPLFEKRWKSRQAGDSRLMETESDWKLWKNKIVELAGRYGMTPNAFVDALTVSIGARAIYETKRKEYIKLGYTQDQAEEKAKRDATVLFNESQQSNESAFLSAAQVDRTVASILITVFRNSSMGYQRMYVDALRNIKHMLKKGYKAESLEYMKKQMMRDGLTEDQAERAANRIYNKSFARSATRLATFGFLVQFAWNLGPYMAYLLMGDDDDEKKDMIKDAAVRGLVGGPVEGLAAGQAISGVLGDFAMSEEISDPMLKLPATSDMESIFRQLEVDPVRAVNDIFNLVIQSGIGVNPQTLTDAVVAIIDGCNGDLETSKEAAFALMRILQTPQSQIEKLYMEEIDFTAEEALDMSVREFAERYAKYKVMRTAPLTKWMYSDEKEKELEDKYIKTFTKKASEMERTHGTEEAQEFFEYYDSEYEETAETLRDLKKQLKETILDSDTEGEAKANEDLDNFLESEEFKRFEELLPHIKAYEAYRKALKTTDDPKMRSEFAEKMIQERNAAVEKLRGE